MSEVTADTAGIAAYGATAAGMAASMTTAAATAAVAGPELLGPVFGLIGGDFLAAFASAHAAHLGAIAQASSTLAGIGDAAIGTAAAYAGTDAAHAVGLGTIAGGVDG
ncbi:type VII secretion target [Aldersonia sp. NBC_00410]|jgi:Excreted virulence factor EspC, type VII ESX diderm|uniref:type VII secretion target n=1 Tax=Aldersonia sp. NBC_00410 TaxID=2975954 RepID=UPI00225B989A|nr:type VII secretion target [Aldersonia sp. NBC_00410]MCX5044475.1 type VII secretion target [Aldersonia sp. NBC_00410]